MRCVPTAIKILNWVSISTGPIREGSGSRPPGGGWVFLTPPGVPPWEGGVPPPPPPAGGGPDVRHFLASKGDPRHSKCPSGAEKRAFDIGGSEIPTPRPAAYCLSPP